MEILRRASDYALRCLVRLARTSDRHIEALRRLASMQGVPEHLVKKTLLVRSGHGRVESARHLASKEDVPEPLLRKVLQKLTQAGIVESVRGVRGGFRLSLPPEEITVLMVMEAVQGPVAITRCFLREDSCPHQEKCDLRLKLRRTQREVNEVLRRTTIRDLAGRSKRDRSVRAMLLSDARKREGDRLADSATARNTGGQATQVLIKEKGGVSK